MRPLALRLAYLGSLIVTAALPATGQELRPIEYRLSFPGHRQHLAEVEARIPCDPDAPLDVFMAVWTPGSYLVREYARHVEGLRAEDAAGRPLALTKTRKNRWRVAASSGTFVRLRYRVYGREMSVRTNWIDADFAVLNGAPTFITRVERGPRPHHLKVELPKSWRHAICALDKSKGDGRMFSADSFDALVDAPLLCGNPELYPFEVAGVPHLLVNQGAGGLWDGARASRDLGRIVEQNRRLWGRLPYQRYIFFNVVGETGGGLEHANSTLMMTRRWNDRRADSYRGWLSLASHEFFHTFNVKRLRPRSLGPFDYERENYTESLWIAEGVTSYYTWLLLARAGLTTPKQSLAKLSAQIQSLQNKPGRKVQSLAASSFDAWIKHYRRDENSVNTSVSYYNKGALVACLLDARIREASDGRASLDDVLRNAFERHAGAQGFRPGEFQAIVAELSNSETAAWLRTTLGSTEELDYQPLERVFGLKFKKPDTQAGLVQRADGRRVQPGWLGLELEQRAGRAFIRQLRRGTPAYRGGLNVDDEVLAVNGYRVAFDSWNKLREGYDAGAPAQLLIARRGRILEFPLRFEAKPTASWVLEARPGRYAKTRRVWLGSPRLH